MAARPDPGIKVLALLRGGPNPAQALAESSENRYLSKEDRRAAARRDCKDELIIAGHRVL